MSALALGTSMTTRRKKRPEMDHASSTDVKIDFVSFANFVLHGMPEFAWLTIFPPEMRQMLPIVCKKLQTPQPMTLSLVKGPHMLNSHLHGLHARYNIESLTWRKQVSLTPYLKQFFDELTPVLKHLDLGENWFDWNDIRYICDRLTVLTTLQYLDISHAMHPDVNGGIEDSRDALVNISTLTHLNMSGLTMPRDILPIAEFLENCTALQTLDVSRSNLYLGPGNVQFWDACTTLTDLNISACNINTMEMQGAFHLSKLTKLVRLNLQDNQICYYGVLYLVRYLRPLTLLADLNVRGNVLSQVGMHYLQTQLTHVNVNM